MNLGGRVCLRTTNHIQSDMIIHHSATEKLFGNGDLFFLSIGDSMRLQAPYLPADKRDRILAKPMRILQGAGASHPYDHTCRAASYPPNCAISDTHGIGRRTEGRD